MSNDETFSIHGVVNTTPSHGRLDRPVITIAGTRRGEPVVMHLEGTLPAFGDGSSFHLNKVFVGHKPQESNTSILRGGNSQETLAVPLAVDHKPVEVRGSIGSTTIINNVTGTWVPDKNAVNNDQKALRQIEDAVNAFLKRDVSIKMESEGKAIFHEPQAHERLIPADVLKQARDAVAPGQPAAGIPQIPVQESGKVGVREM
jgi:hypothetical protein